MSSKKSVISGPVKAPLGSYPKLWRLLDHYFLKEDVPDRAAVQALDTIVDLNNAVLSNPKSANLRSIRSSEARIRNLVEMGGTEILSEIGWSFKVMSMEECWVLPYDADLELLRTQQDKIVETQLKLKARYAKSVADASGKAEKDKADRLAVIKQIEHDKAEREHRNALRTGAPPKVTLSLDEVRKQAVKERMEREKAKKAGAASSSDTSSSSTPRFPGTFPMDESHARPTRAQSPGMTGHQGTTIEDDKDQEEMDVDDNIEEEEDIDDYDNGEQRLGHQAQQMPAGGPGHRLGRADGGRSPRQPQNLRQRKKAPVPISVKKPVVRQTYQATENTLGGSGPSDADPSSAPLQNEDPSDITTERDSRSRLSTSIQSQSNEDLLD